MLRILLIALTVAACSGPSTPPPPPPVTPSAPEPAPEPTTTAKADGASCLDAAECESGICEGEGCGADTPGTCAPKGRGCTRDLRPYCGCDGQTFRTSGTCPGKRFSARTECP